MLNLSFFKGQKVLTHGNYLLYMTNTETQQRIKNVNGQVDESIIAKTMWKKMLAAQMSNAYGIRFFGLPPKLTRILMIFMRTLVDWPMEPVISVNCSRYVELALSFVFNLNLKYASELIKTFHGNRVAMPNSKKIK